MGRKKMKVIMFECFRSKSGRPQATTLAAPHQLLSWKLQVRKKGDCFQNIYPQCENISTLPETDYFSAVSRRSQGVGDHENDLHSTRRPQSLQTRLQVSGVAGESHQSRQCSGLFYS